MKLSCEKASLLSAISVTSRATASKSTIPSLEGILIEAYEELLLLGSDKYKVKLGHVPEGVTQVRIHPEQVDFLIEQIPSDYGN